MYNAINNNSWLKLFCVQKANIVKGAVEWKTVKSITVTGTSCYTSRVTVILFLSRTSHRRIGRTTVKLLQHEISEFIPPELRPQTAQTEPICYKIW